MNQVQNNQNANSIRVGILIDGNNINRGIKNPDQQVNYELLVNRVLAGRALIKFFYFQEGEINQAFAYQLHQSLFGVVRSCKKSADVPLTVQAIQLANEVDTLILGSGDVDYKDLLSYLRSKGVTIEIISFRDSLSYEINNYADFVHYVKDQDLMKKQIGSNTSPEKKSHQQNQPKSKSKTSKLISDLLTFKEDINSSKIQETILPVNTQTIQETILPKKKPVKKKPAKK